MWARPARLPSDQPHSAALPSASTEQPPQGKEDNLAPHEGQKLTSRLGSVKHAGCSEVVDGTARTGMLGREKQPLPLSS